MSNDDHLHSIIADYGDACAEMQAELDRLRAEYDEMGVLLADKHNTISALRTELAAKDARVAELENKNSYNLQIVREATARIAELADQPPAKVSAISSPRSFSPSPVI